MNVFWFIPTHGDSRYLGTSEGARPVTHDYMKQIAVAADTLGYDGVLLPTGRSCEDAWVAAASLIDATQRLKFLVAVRPGLTAPTLSARMAATFDRLSNGRLLINVVTGGDPVEQDKFDIVAPSISILTEPPVAVVDKVADRRGTRKVAEEYLKYLYSEQGQEIIAKNYYRPIDPKIAAKYASQFPKLNLVTIDKDFGGWQKAQKTHFADGGTFDQLYAPNKK